MPRGGATPVYLLIEDHLRKLVSKAQPGDLLPSDNELCERFGVSRMTARQAVQRLAADGLLYRVSGSGTFVAQPRVHRRVNQLLSFTKEMQRRGLEPSSQVVDSALRRSTPQEALALQLKPEDRVVFLRRLRRADGAAMAVEQVVLPANCATVLDEDLSTGSLHEALQRIGRVPTRAVGTVEAVLAGDRDADQLDVREGAALLVERRTIWDQNGVPLEFTETRYAGERYIFDVELQRYEDEPADVGIGVDRGPVYQPHS